MYRLKSFIPFLVLLLIVIFSSTGCEKISNIAALFKKEKSISTLTKSDSSTEVRGVAAAKTSKNEPLEQDVLARVGEWTVTVDEFDDRLKALKEVVPQYDIENPESKKLVLDELVRQQLFVLEAEQSGVANQKDILAAIEEFKRTLIVREMVGTITADLEVTEEEALAFYEENKARLVEPGEWRVSEIVVKDKIAASELSTRLLKGEDFATLAKENSVGATAAQGGDLGLINDVPFAEMAPALLELKIGEVSQVFQGPEGFYIVKLVDKKEGKTIPYETIKEDIVNSQMLQKQQQLIKNYLETLEGKFTITVNEDLLTQ